MVGCWHRYLSGAQCRLAYGPADATATHCLLLLVKSRLVFTFLVPAHLGSPGQRAVKRVCVWYRLTRVVLDKGELNGCVCVNKLLLHYPNTQLMIEQKYALWEKTTSI